MPCTAGGAPVTIDALFGLVKVGTTASASPTNPVSRSPAMVGRMPSARPRRMYAGSQPSKQMTATGLPGTLYRRPFTTTSATLPSRSVRLAGGIVLDPSARLQPSHGEEAD